MDITGEHTIKAPRERVWRRLNDPEALGGVIPGCEALEAVSDREFHARVLAKIGPVKARFETVITLSEVNPPQSYTITGEGKGGAAGFARGSADVLLEETAEGTALKYTARIQAGGKLAQVGSRLLGGTVRKLAGEFFAAFAASFGDPEAPAAET